MPTRDEFWKLLMTFINSSDPNDAPKMLGLFWDPNCWTLRLYVGKNLGLKQQEKKKKKLLSFQDLIYVFYINFSSDLLSLLFI